MPIRDELLRLRDGRALAFAEWGDAASGSTVFFFHGTPHSRLWCPEPEVAAERGVRVITVDRPGFGRSDPQPGHRMTSWPEDVTELADALGAERFGVVGWSAGAKNAAACAFAIPRRLSGVAAVSGFRKPAREPPEDYRELQPKDLSTIELADRDPAAAVEQVAEREAEWGRRLAEDPTLIWEGSSGPAAGDRWFVDDPVRIAPWYAAIVESFRQGTIGFALEDVAEVLPWGFALADIEAPVHLFHGEQDGRQGPRLEYWSLAIPHAEVTIWRDVGHLGIVRHWAEILDAVRPA